MGLRFCAGTDAGRKRATNQDSLLADDALRLYAVADGMGGHADGGLASRLVVDSIRTFFVETSLDDSKTWPFGFDLALSYSANRLKAAVLTANLKIADHIDGHKDARGMGATLAAVCFGDERAVIANVGDCRAYLAEGAVMKQLTRDHSWVAEQVQSGFLSEDTARTHPWRHMVTRAVQGNTDLDVDVLEIDLPRHGRLLLCSDGLHGVLPEDDLKKLLVDGSGGVEGICGALIEAANQHGAPDNVSAIVLDW